MWTCLNEVIALAWRSSVSALSPSLVRYRPDLMTSLRACPGPPGGGVEYLIMCHIDFPPFQTMWTQDDWRCSFQEPLIKLASVDEVQLCAQTMDKPTARRISDAACPSWGGVGVGVTDAGGGGSASPSRASPVRPDRSLARAVFAVLLLLFLMARPTTGLRCYTDLEATKVINMPPYDTETAVIKSF